jgi:hypothetical protein
MELIVRARRGQILSFGSIHGSPDVLNTNVPADYDPYLGWMCTPGARVRSAESTITIDDQGFRSNGSEMPSGGAPILAVGDSFTFGDEVSDEETWPANLEGILSRRVLNGGVSAYGFDQIVLRTERILERMKVGGLIVCIIGDSVNRCQYSYRWGGWKPYFDVESNKIGIRNVPVPKSPPPSPKWSPVRKILGYSYACDAVFLRAAPEWWLFERAIVQVHRRGIDVSVLLVDRIAELKRAYGLPVLLVVEFAPGSHRRLVEPMISRALETGLTVLDLSTRSEMRNRPNHSEMYKQSHLSSVGNRWVAEEIASVFGAMKEESSE